MRFFFRVSLIGFLFLSMNILNAQASKKQFGEESQTKLLNTKLITEKINIDGEMTEPVWNEAYFDDSFQQREPGDGDPPTERTEIGCLYDERYLYFAIKCYDSEPDKIVRTELRRDAYMDNDDYFEIVLDTYHDQRSAFYFIFNAYGNKRDAKMSDEGRNYNPEWDGIWQCKSKITDQGWFAELAIPWKTLRFVEGENIYFGVNFGRMIRRKNEKLDWSHIPREVGGHGIFKLNYAGDVGPFKGLHMGGNLELQPFLIGGMQKDHQTEMNLKRIGDGGIDAKINLTSNLIADLTYNTDFAQVEADQEQVNLTRFSLYFPEKREFFLEGAEIFNTSSRYGNAPILFYSRRIGIHRNHEIPLWGGAKITGKVNGTTIGLINMISRQTTLINDSKETIPSTNYSVLRLKQDIFNQSTVGLLLTGNITNNKGHNNQTYGVDSRLVFSPTLTLNTLVSGTQTSDISKQRNNAANFGLSWDTDLYRASLEYTDIEENFKPEMGFVRRTDIRHTSGRFSYSPRPEQFESVRKFSYGIDADYLTDQNNALLERETGFSYSIHFQSAAEFQLEAERYYEKLPDDWEVRSAIFINEGVYEGNQFSVEYKSDPSKPLAMKAELSAADYYGGDRYSLSGSVDWKGFKKFILNSDYRLNKIKLPHAQFNTFTLSNRLIYAFSTEAFLKGYIQYNSDRLRFDDRVKWNVNLLFRYIFKPGSDFYLVYNQEQFVGNNNDTLINRTLMAKVVYFWRK